MTAKRNLRLKFSIILFFLTMANLAGDSPLFSAAPEADPIDPLIGVLKSGLIQEKDFWASVHAAEDLIGNGYLQPVREAFAGREHDPRPQVRIGIWRVLARLNRDNRPEFARLQKRILAAFLDPAGGDRVHALETLAKLGFAEPLPDIRETAQRPGGALQPLARWVLANSGKAEDESRFAALLESKDPQVRMLTAYGLRFLPHIGMETLARLKTVWRNTASGDRERVYLAGAIFVHSPPSQREEARGLLMRFGNGTKEEKAEVCEAFASKGDRRDIPFLRSLGNCPEIDVRVGAANARIRIGRRQLKGMRWPDWAVILALGLLLLVVGWHYSRRQKNRDDFLLGGRKVHPLVSGISLFTSLISTISFLAIPGETLKFGPGYIIIYFLSLPIVYLLTAYLLIPFFMKLPITSAYELLEKPLGRKVRLTGSLIFLMVRVVWMSLLIYLAARVVVVMMNWNERHIPLMILATGAVTVAFSALGGLRAVMATAVIKFILLLLGTFFILILVTVEMGGIGAWFPSAWAGGWDRFIIFSFDPHIRVTVIGLMLMTISWWVCTAGSDQMAIQRYLATRNLRAARRTFLINNIADVSITLLLGLVGFALLGFFNARPYLVADGRSMLADADYLFPHFIANFLPTGVTGLVLAGILATAMSSLASGINASTAVISSDFLERLRFRKPTGGNQLKQTKYVSLAIGAIVVIASTQIGKVPGNVIEVTNKTNGLFIAPLFNLFFMAMFVRFATPFGAIWGSVYGLAAAGIVAFWDVLTGAPGIGFQWILPVSLLVSVLSGMLFSLIPLRHRPPIHGWIWSALPAAPLVVIFVLLIR